MPVIEERESTELVKDYYTQYAQYVLTSRSIPQMIDGFKSVQRRLVWCASKLPTSISKSAKIIGDTMPYHPHEDGSAYGALVNLTTKTNRFHLFESHGNFGSPGFAASAMRYTGASLNEMARFCYTQFAEYADYHLGETDLMEPVALPALIPYALVNGSEGIAVGLNTNVMPLNLMELIDYFIDTLKGKRKKKIPTPDVGNFILDMEDEEIDEAAFHYTGKLKVSSIISQENSTTVVIDDLYQGSGKGRKTIDDICHKLSDWIDTGKVDFRDETGMTARYVFEIMDNSISIDELTKKLKSLTERQKTFKRVLVEDGTGIFADLDYQVNCTLVYLRKAIERKFSSELEKLQYNEKILLAIELIKSSGLLEKISVLSKDELVDELVKLGVEDDIAKEALKRPISYLTKSHLNELKDIKDKIRENRDTDITKYMISLYRQFKKIAAPQYNSYPHTIRKSQVLKNPKAKVIDEHTIRISDDTDGVTCSSLFIVWRDGVIEPFSLGSVIRKDVAVESSIGGIASRKDGKYLVSITSNDRILTIDLDRISAKKKFINLDDGEEVIHTMTFADEKHDKIRYKKHRGNGMKYLVSKLSKPRTW